jgi:hypothetical protein
MAQRLFPDKNAKKRFLPKVVFINAVPYMESYSDKFHIDIPTSCEHVLVALTVCAWRAVESALSSDRSDRLASPSETDKNEEFHYRHRHYIVIHQQPALCCLKTKHIVKSVRVLSGIQS